MLLSIAYPTNVRVFENCVRAIRYAYWPDEMLLSQIKAKNPSKATKELKDMIPKVKPYQLIWSQGNGKNLPMPFINHFHDLFGSRASNIFKEIDLNPKNATRMHKPKSKEIAQTFKCPIYFYSKNSGNFNHFINVVMAMARLIQYFCENNNGLENLRRIIFDNPRFRYQDRYSEKSHQDQLLQDLIFPANPNIRVFKLMLAAFYHDIGKSVVEHRHGMEGAIILSDHNSDSWYELYQIAEKSDLYKKKSGNVFERDDLLNIGDMLRYHDLFGTMSTGEAGYIKYAELINKLKHFSYRDMRQGRNQKVNRRQLFDIWLLNVADIMVSRNEKFEIQEKYFMDQAAAETRISEYFKRKKFPQIACQSELLIHDLFIGFDLLYHLNKNMHSDDIHTLSSSSREHAANHTIERIKRLITAVLNQAEPNIDLKNIASKNLHLYQCIFENQRCEFFCDWFTEEQIHNTILNAITSIANYQEFIDRFSWIGNLDYALGFFLSLGKYAKYMIIREILGLHPRTGWLRDLEASSIANGSSEINAQIQANFFLTNYTTVVVRLIAHLLFRNQTIQELKNFEFKDAADRLKNTLGEPMEKKLRKLLIQEGPYRADMSTQMILETIFVY